MTLASFLASTDSTSQQELYRTIQAQNVLMNNMGLMVMDAADSIESHQYTFGGLAECYQQFIMDIAGAAEIPVTRLFGRSPSGLNATGESDLQNYYEMIAEKQETYLRPIFSKLLPVICMSVFGAVPDDLDFEFDPVAEPSDEQRADLAKTGTDIVVSAVGAGLVSPRTGLKELKQQSERTNVWTNITDEDIEKASDEIDQGEMDMGGFPGMGGIEPTDVPQGPEEGEQVETTAPQQQTADAARVSVIDVWDWEESDHPRGQPKNAGQFAKKGAGTSNRKAKKKDLNNSTANAKMYAKNNPPPAPPVKKAYYRKELVGYMVKGLGKIKAVSDHTCDQFYDRRISTDAVKEVLSKGEKYPDIKHGGYIYEYADVKVSLTEDGVMKTIFTKETDGMQQGLEEQLERWLAKNGGAT